MKKVFLTLAILSTLSLTSSFASDSIGDCETISMEEMPQSLWCDTF